MNRNGLLPAVFMLTILGGSMGQSGCGDTHDSTPHTGSLSDAERRIAAIQESDYYKRLQPLKVFVQDKVVAGSIAGNAGFVLLLNDGAWVAAFRNGEEIGSEFGLGKPNENVISKIRSANYGDATTPTGGDRMYANETCNIPGEVGKSHGKRLKGLSFGERTFNFIFEEKRELDFHLVNDKSGRPAFRVFWEQW